jgi:hypothetical protein
MPAVRLAAHFRPDTVSADQFLLRTPAVAGRTTDMADLSTVRTP